MRERERERCARCGEMVYYNIIMIEIDTGIHVHMEYNMCVRERENSLQELIINTGLKIPSLTGGEHRPGAEREREGERGERGEGERLEVNNVCSLIM